MNTIPNLSRVDYIRYTPSFSVICSIGKAPFHGVAEIEYRPDQLLLEFESVEQWFRSIATQSYEIESLTRLVFGEVERVLGDIPLRVTLRAETTVHAPVTARIQKGDWS